MWRRGSSGRHFRDLHPSFSPPNNLNRRNDQQSTNNNNNNTNTTTTNNINNINNDDAEIQALGKAQAREQAESWGRGKPDASVADDAKSAVHNAVRSAEAGGGGGGGGGGGPGAGGTNSTEARGAEDAALRERERARVLELEVTMARERQAAASKDLERSEVGEAGGTPSGKGAVFSCRRDGVGCSSVGDQIWGSWVWSSDRLMGSRLYHLVLF